MASRGVGAQFMEALATKFGVRQMRFGSHPVALEGIADRFLPECTFRGRDKRKLRFAVLAVAVLHGGGEPDLLEEVVWWQTGDFWPVRLVRSDCLYPCRRRPGGCARAPGMPGAIPARTAPRFVSLPRRPNVSGANDIGEPNVEPTSADAEPRLATKNHGFCR
jgi:hypothetical protein